jgi:hypothetical protein
MRAFLPGLLLTTLAAPALAGEWNFRVLLDGREIGRHVYSLESGDGRQVITSEARFDVRLLFISAWSYDHRAVERWQAGCLQALDSWTDVNGEKTSVQARRVGERLTVARPEGRDEHGGCVMSFAYWDPRILEATRLLNSQTGELTPVEIRPQGVESVEVQGRPVEAERHRIAGKDLQIDLWYADGRWVALEALAAGGRVLRYELAEGRDS